MIFSYSSYFYLEENMANDAKPKHYSVVISGTEKPLMSPWLETKTVHYFYNGASPYTRKAALLKELCLGTVHGSKHVDIMDAEF